VPYAVSFALMPVFVAQASSPSLWPTPLIVALSVLVGVTAHLLNAIPDIYIDRETGWGGLAVSLGKRCSVILAALLVTVGVVCLGVVINELLNA
jgi:4-hydroxybenzoate polyprenyltransferase